MFHQTFGHHDLVVIGVLVVLEGVLSLDNALVLGLLARRLPRRLQSRALMYGMLGALVFRILAIVLAGFLLHWRLPKLLGGLYLVYVAVKHFVVAESSVHDENSSSADTHPSTDAADSVLSRQFWSAVLAIELTDLAFAIDSIVAAVALISTGPDSSSDTINPKLWLVVVGGMLGVILMRFAAMGFLRLLRQFPRLETSAYLLVLIIGGKLILDYAVNAGVGKDRLDFQSVTAPAFWAFWTLMLICFLAGFIPRSSATAEAIESESTPG